MSRTRLAREASGTAGSPGSPASIAAIDIVIPARDEEELLGGAIESVLESRRQLRRALKNGLMRSPQQTLTRVPKNAPRALSLPSCRVVVVLDACVDGSLEVARSFGAAIEIVEVDFASVGRARAAGIDELLSRPGTVPPGRHWLCSTDADSRPAPDWLLRHLAAAEAGALVALGRVMPAPGDLPAAAHAEWERLHATGLRHVFGADLGVRADAYLLAGGFPSRQTGEDEALVSAVDGLDESLLSILPHRGARVVELGGIPTETSGRLEGRAPEGFAGYLQGLAD